MIVLLILGGIMAGCSDRHIAGGLIGGAAVGGAYEYQNKRALDRLESDLAAGRISIREYQRRRAEIDDRSVIY